MYSRAPYSKMPYSRPYGVVQVFSQILSATVDSIATLAGILYDVKYSEVGV